MANRSHVKEPSERRTLLPSTPAIETDEENDPENEGPSSPVLEHRSSPHASHPDSADDDANSTEAAVTEADQELREAIEASDETAVKESLRQADPNVSFGSKKLKCLHLAVKTGNLKIIQLLVKAGADVNATDSKGVTPLHVAAGAGLTKVIELLVKLGADLNAKDWAVIKEGTKRGSPPVPSDKTVPPKFTDKISHENENQSDGTRNQTELIQLIEIEASPSESSSKTPIKERERRCETPLHQATRKGQLASVRKLLSLGAEIDALEGKGKTALHLAAELGKVDIMQLLLERKANANAKDRNGDSPLHSATRNAHLSAVEALLLRGVEIEALDGQEKTALHVAAELGHVDIMQLLLDRQANPNAKNKDGDSPFLLLVKFMAGQSRNAQRCKETLAQLLIKIEACVNDVSDHANKASLLRQVVTLGQLEATEVLLSEADISEADIKNTKDAEENTVLHSCCMTGNSDILGALVKDKRTQSMIDSRDSKGWTPLHKAAHYGSTECIRILISARADLGLKTNAGVSAMTMILQLPQGPKILSEMFNESITTNGIDPSEAACELKFNYSILTSKHKKQQMCVIEDILDIQNEHRTADLFQHPVIASFLFLKWRKIRSLFFSIVIAYVLLVVGITANVYTALIQDKHLNGTESDQLNNLTQYSLDSTDEPFFIMFQILMIFIVIIIIFQEIVQFVSMPGQYFKETESYVKLGTLITSSILVFQPIPWSEWVHIVAAWAVLFGWAEVTFLIGRLPTFGVYALMFYSVAEHLGKLFIVFCFFLFGFSFSFHIIFLEHKSEAFSNPWSSLLRTLGMMTGDFSYDEYLTGGKQSMPVTAHLIYFFFLMLISLVLMNLLIGLAVNDTQTLQKEGTVARLRKQAQFIIHLEDVVNNQAFHKLLCSSVVDKMNSWVNQKPLFTMQPSARKQNIRLPAGVVEEALSIAQKAKEPTVESTLNDTYDVVQECLSAVWNLDKRINDIQQDLSKLKKLVGGPSVAKLGSKVKHFFGGKDSRESASQPTDYQIQSEEKDDYAASTYQRQPSERARRNSKLTKMATSSSDTDLNEIKSLLLELKASIKSS